MYNLSCNLIKLSFPRSIMGWNVKIRYSNLFFTSVLKDSHSLKAIYTKNELCKMRAKDASRIPQHWEYTIVYILTSASKSSLSVPSHLTGNCKI